jgi:hypothetical protein
MNVIVKVIPHASQRYETCGDWYFNSDNSQLYIMVSDTGNAQFNFLVAFHEQIEAMLCLERNIKEEDVTAFDEKYESERKAGDNTSEPGDNLEAPYYKEHQYATVCERSLAEQLGVNWEEYEKAIYSL